MKASSKATRLRSGSISLLSGLWLISESTSSAHAVVSEETNHILADIEAAAPTGLDNVASTEDVTVTPTAITVASYQGTVTLPTDPAAGLVVNSLLAEPITIGLPFNKKSKACQAARWRYLGLREQQRLKDGASAERRRVCADHYCY